MKVFKTSFWIAFVLSLGYMAWRAVANKGLVCGYLKVESCGTVAWLSQLGLMFAVIFIVFMVLFLILTRKKDRFGIEGMKIKKDVGKKKIQLDIGAGELERMHTAKELKKRKFKKIKI